MQNRIEFSVDGLASLFYQTMQGTEKCKWWTENIMALIALQYEQAYYMAQIFYLSKSEAFNGMLIVLRMYNGAK